MLRTDTTWYGAVPTLIVLTGILWLPGGLVALAAGASARLAAVLGPGISVVLVSVGGVLAGAVGLRWSPWVLVGLGLATSAAALGLSSLARRGRRGPTGSVPYGAARVGSWFPWWVAGWVGAAAGFTAWAYTSEARLATALPQQPDTLYHLGAAMWMRSAGEISSLHTAGFSGSGSGFYPAAFHGVVVTAMQLGAPSAAAASTSLALLCAALVWPLGLVALARRLFGASPTVTAGAAIGAVAFTAYPVFLMGYGVLWPLLLGYALLPGALVCLVDLIDRVQPLRAVVLLGLLLPGIALAHPDALIALGVVGAVWAAGAVVAVALKRDQTWRTRAVAGAALGSAAVVTVIVWRLLTERSADMMASNPKGGEVSVATAVRWTLLLAPRDTQPLWIAAFAVGLGVVALLVRRPQRWWLAVSLLVTAWLFLATAGIDSPRTRLLTWPWYNNSPRLAALMILPCALLAGWGMASVVDIVLRVARGRRRLTPRGELEVATMLLAALTVPVLVQAGSAQREVLARWFDPSQTSWGSPTSLAALRELATYIPQDATVAANPWRGATYLYVVSGRRMLIPSEKALTTLDRITLAKELTSVGSSPEVCQLAQKLHVDYAITGGRPLTPGAARPAALRRYEGIDGVGSSRAFQRVAQAGDYTLYRRVACAGT